MALQLPARLLAVGTLILTTLFLSPGQVQAQSIPHGEAGHICGTDLSSPESLEALENFRRAREAGTLAVARKSASPPEIGSRQVFRVSEDSWIDVEFELMDKEDGLYYLWVSVHELDSGRITEQVIQDLRTALVEATPGGVINENAGVIANNEVVLGPPPDFDGDGVTDVLMYDIDPNDDTPGSFIAGYVTSSDINPNAAPGIGNQADVLYLDSNQGISSGATPSTAAHEYAHLIHFATGFDTDTFISEGIAEYLTVVNGLGRSRYNHLALPGEASLPLFNWRSGSSDVVRDYAKAELFFRYIGEQFGPEAVSAIAGNPHKGAAGIDSVLSSYGSDLATVVADHHSANLVNDRRIDFRFGYGSDVSSSGVQAHVGTTYSGAAATSTPPFADGETPALESGAANYVEFRNVADLRLSFDAAAAPVLLDSARERIAARAFLQDELGAYSYRDIEAREDPYVIAGNYYKVQVVFAHTVPGSSVIVRYDYGADWAPFGQATPVDDAPELPQTVALDQNFPNPFNPSTTIGWQLPESGAVTIRVFDQLGRMVGTVADGHFPAGSHEARFDGSHLASGSYLYVLDAGGQRLTRQFTLLK
ncbi:MAG: T9SS type A sorting domain-containing protein [Rhodothermales bacterium]|nr:T9SS type A sorting domain-containing protein [Rhodothermales bacterium]